MALWRVQLPFQVLENKLPLYLPLTGKAAGSLVALVATFLPAWAMSRGGGRITRTSGALCKNLHGGQAAHTWWTLEIKKRPGQG